MNGNQKGCIWLSSVLLISCCYWINNFNQLEYEDDDGDDTHDNGNEEGRTHELSCGLI